MGGKCQVPLAVIRWVVTRSLGSTISTWIYPRRGRNHGVSIGFIRYHKPTRGCSREPILTAGRRVSAVGCEQLSTYGALKQIISNNHHVIGQLVGHAPKTIATIMLSSPFTTLWHEPLWYLMVRMSLHNSPRIMISNHEASVTRSLPGFWLEPVLEGSKGNQHTGNSLVVLIACDMCKWALPK